MSVPYSKQFGVTLALTLGAEDVHTDSFTSTVVRRHVLGLGGEWSRPLGDAMRLGVGIRGGAVAFLRDTLSRSPDAQALPSRTSVRPFVGPELRAAWRFTPLVSIVIALGLDIVPDALRVSYIVDGITYDAYSFWSLEPRFMVGCELGASVPGGR
jgi:hypothetical protein